MTAQPQPPTPEQAEMEDVRRRIVAARTLRGISQLELQRLLAEEGLGRQELGRLERGEFTLTRVRRRAICDVLRIPEEWFTAATVDELFGLVRPKGSDEAAGLRLPPPGGELGRFAGDGQPSRADHPRSQNPRARDDRQGNGG